MYVWNTKVVWLTHVWLCSYTRIAQHDPWDELRREVGGLLSRFAKISAQTRCQSRSAVRSPASLAHHRACTVMLQLRRWKRHTRLAGAQAFTRLASDSREPLRTPQYCRRPLRSGIARRWGARLVESRAASHVWRTPNSNGGHLLGLLPTYP